MWKLFTIVLVGSMVAYLWVVQFSSDGYSSRMASWAQLVAAGGSVAAAALAFQTARENRNLAESSNRSLAAATRPRLTLYFAPSPDQFGHCQPNQEVHLSIVNNSSFDAMKCRIEWSTVDGHRKQALVGRLYATPDSSSGSFGESVRYTGEHRTSESVSMGNVTDWPEGEQRVTLYTASTFSVGGWREEHTWNTWQDSDDPENPHWTGEHTVSVAEWLPLSDLGF